MDPRVRHSFSARVVAVGFIALILLGNYAIVLLVVGDEIPRWFTDVASVAIVAVVAGGLGLLTVTLWLRRAERQDRH